MLRPGTIHIDATLKSNGRVSFVVSNTRTSSAAAMLASDERRARARKLIPMLYGLCPIAHLTAFDCARAAARGMTSTERRALTGALPEEAASLEAVAESLRVLVMDASAMTGLRVPFEHLQALGRLRSSLGTAAQHVLALDPLRKLSDEDERWAAAARTCLENIREDAGSLAETLLFGMPVDLFLASVESPEGFVLWADRNKESLPAAKLFADFAKRPIDFGRIDLPMLPSLCRFRQGEEAFEPFAEELLHRMLHEPGFDLSPVWRASPRLTGALPRTLRHPGIATLVKNRGVTALTLLAARLVDTGLLLSNRLLPKNHRPMTYSPETGSALCLLETARGLLVHAVRTDEAGLAHALRITSPTEWQFAPEGPGQQAAARLARSLNAECSAETPVDEETATRLLRAVLFGIDACVPLDIRFRSA